MPTRREMLKTALAMPAAAALSPETRRDRPQGPVVVVVGAGAFGGWTALELARRGARVTLLDAWGPGNVRASSGGETRVIRASYGTRAVYTRMAKRSLELWRAHDKTFDRRFFKETGALWMFADDASFGRASAAALRADQLTMEELTPAEAARRYPQINLKGVATLFYEPDAGYLLARRACEHVLERFVVEGGTYHQRAVASPVRIGRVKLERLDTSGGSAVSAEDRKSVV